MIWGKFGTIEWRCHPISQNPHKMLNWLYICNAIMAYAFTHKDEIAAFSDLKNINLDAILKDVYSPKLAETLSNYIQWRKDYMQSMDPQGDRELAEDLSMNVPFSVLY